MKRRTLSLNTYDQKHSIPDDIEIMKSVNWHIFDVYFTAEDIRITLGAGGCSDKEEETRDGGVSVTYRGHKQRATWRSYAYVKNTGRVECYYMPEYRFSEICIGIDEREISVNIYLRPEGTSKARMAFHFSFPVAIDYAFEDGKRIGEKEGREKERSRIMKVCKVKV